MLRIDQPLRLLLFVLLSLCATARSADLVENVRRDTETLCASPTRVPGSPGMAEARELIARRVAAVSDAVLLRQTFPVIMPQAQRAIIKVKGTAHTIHPLWPDNARLNTTPEGGFQGTPVYVSGARYEDIPVRSLRGQIAVAEMADYRRGDWTRVFDAGADALLLLGSGDDTAAMPRDIPFYKPRYYVPAGELCNQLRQGLIKQVHIECDASWQTVTAESLLVALPGTDPDGSAPLMLMAPLDAMSVVPALAPGADNAVDAAFVLNLLELLGRHRPPRSVLFAFVDASAINQMGPRQVMAMLSISPEDGTRRSYEEIDAELLTEYEGVQQQVAALGTDPLGALSRLHDKRTYPLLQRYVKDVLSPELLHLREEAGELRLERDYAEGEERARLEARLKEMTARQLELNRVLGGIMLEEKAIPEDLLGEAERIWTTVTRRVADQLAAARARAGMFAELDELRTQVHTALGLPEATGLSVPFAFGVDLSDGNTVVGPALWCEHEMQNQTAESRSFLRWLKASILGEDSAPFATIPDERLADLGLSREALPALVNGVLNKEAVDASLDPRSFVGEPLALITGPVTGFGLNGVTWSTLESLRPRLDTPQDRPERLDWSRLEPQIRLTALILETLLHDTGFVPGDSQSTGLPRWRMVHGSVVTESVAETIARTPVSGLLATTVTRAVGQGVTRTSGVRGHEFVRTGADGGFRFVPVEAHNHWIPGNQMLLAYKLDERGRIVTGLSDATSMIAGRVASNFSLGERPPMKPLRAVAFDCVELNGPLFRDPRYQARLSSYSVIDVLRGGAPKRYQFSVANGQMFGLLQPDSQWQLVLRFGTGNNRMALLNIPEDLNETKQSLRQALSHGFKVEEELPELPELISARDFYRIDEWRLRRLERAGVICKPIREIHSRGEEWLKRSDEAFTADDGGAYKRAAMMSLANEIRAYQAVQDQADDVTRGAIFLMLLLVPFSVAMERLLFASPGIGKQISYAGLIFFVMAGILWSFHPGFQITSQPLVILLAFLVLLLSMTVVIMVLRKFRADMEEMRRGTQAESSGAQTSRGGVINSAIWLGIANMRKRLVRTLLTGLTIVLVTFSLLCFTSSSTYQDKRSVLLSGLEPTHGGVLIQHPAVRELERETEESMRILLGGEARVAGRYWVTTPGPDVTTWRLHVRSRESNNAVELKGALGLRPEEKHFSGVDSLLANWDRFAEGDGCYVSKSVADRLGVEPGAALMVGGVALELLDTYDALTFEETLRKMDGMSLLPTDFTIDTEDTLMTQDVVEAELASGEMLTPDPSMVFVTGNEAVIIPAQLAQNLGASLRSVVAEVPGEAAVSVATRLMESTVFPVYYGTEGAVRAMVSTPLLPKAPRNLMVPIAIAALIIFNTMLNSIAERRREIHIYSSLGLAPRHIGVLFLAEALTYGLMGSVFGYIIGQGVATVLTGFDLMGGITLNYSGSNVMLTMGLVLTIVTLSSLVPAFMAAKAASPNSDLDWSVPRPKDGVIHDLLPFTVSARAAPGLIAYLHDFVDAHRDGAIGNFTSADLRVEQGEDGGGDGTSAIRLRATTWLAPYDQGVRQDFTINVIRGLEDTCTIEITLEHGAGQERTWWRLNRNFLGDLRRQLLGWRNISPERMLAYIKQARS